MLRMLLPLTLWLGLTLTAAGENWPAWRGPQANGHSRERGLPVKWSREENVRWKVKLPGPGNSTPAIWGDRLFLTQALDRDGHQRALLCFDRKSGKELWRQVTEFKGKESTHRDNPYCSASPVTDGERVIASFGSAGVVCSDFAGKLLWRRDLGTFEHIWGNAASPVLYGDLVILNCGPGERTFLIALDKRTGRDVWKVDEPGGLFGHKSSEWIGSWSTPAVVTVNGRDELVMTWPHAVKAYNPRTGELLWTCQGLTRLVYTSPVVSPEVVIAMSGFHGSALAVRPGGQGTVTETHRLWHHSERQPQRIGSGVIVGDHFYMANAGPGTVQCFDWKTGKLRWQERLGDACWGSLVCAEGKLYVTDLAGETFIFKPNPEKLELVGRNHLRERTMASIAVGDGELYIRTHDHLWCIGNPPAGVGK